MKIAGCDMLKALAKVAFHSLFSRSLGVLRVLRGSLPNRPATVAFADGCPDGRGRRGRDAAGAEIAAARKIRRSGRSLFAGSENQCGGSRRARPMLGGTGKGRCRGKGAGGGVWRRCGRVGGASRDGLRPRESRRLAEMGRGGDSPRPRPVARTGWSTTTTTTTKCRPSNSAGSA